MTELQQKIFDLLVEKLDLDKNELVGIDENSLLFAGDDKKEEKKTDKEVTCMNLDSIDALEMTLMIEEEWGLESISSTAVANFTTIKAIEDYILLHKKE